MIVLFNHNRPRPRPSTKLSVTKYKRRRTVWICSFKQYS